METLRDALMEAIDHLDAGMQAHLLEYAQRLQSPVGEPIANLIQDARRIAFPHEDIDEIATIIEAEFEVIGGGELDVPDIAP
jgi:hypothetical protein